MAASKSRFVVAKVFDWDTASRSYTQLYAILNRKLRCVDRIYKSRPLKLLVYLVYLAYDITWQE